MVPCLFHADYISRGGLGRECELALTVQLFSGNFVSVKQKNMAADYQVCKRFL